MLPFTIELFPL